MLVLLCLLSLVAPFLVVRAFGEELVMPKLAATALVVGLTLVWAAVLLLRDRWPAGRSPLAIWVALGVFAVVNILALLFADDPRGSMLGEWQRYQGLATTLLYVLLFVVAAFAVRTTKDVTWLLLALMLAAFGTSIYALVQKAGLDWAGLGARDLTRPGSTVGQANNFGLFLVVVMSTSVYLLLTVRQAERYVQWAVTAAVAGAGIGAYILLLCVLDGGQQMAAGVLGALVLVPATAGIAAVWRDDRLRERWLGLMFQSMVGVMLLTMLFALVYTKSQSAFLAAGGAILLWGAIFLVWFSRRFDEPGDRLAVRVGIGTAVLAPLAIAVIAIAFFGLLGRESITEALDRGTCESESIQGRLTLWRLGVEMTADRPLLGYGQDAFSIQFPGYRDQPDLPGICTTSVDPESAHNYYVDLLSGTGVLGLLSFLALAAAIAYYAVRRVQRTDDMGLRLAIAALGIGLLAQLGGLFFGFAEAMTTWLLWLLLGSLTGLLAEVSEPRETADDGVELGGFAAGLGAMCLAALGAVALGWCFTLAAAEVSSDRADAARRAGDFEGADHRIDRAITLNPLNKEYLLQKAQALETATLTQAAIDAYAKLADRFTPTAYVVMSQGLLEVELIQESQDRPIDTVFPTFDRALALDPFNEEFRIFLADQYDEWGFPERAVEQRYIVLGWRGQQED
jgi:O-antigen ligase